MTRASGLAALIMAAASPAAAQDDVIVITGQGLSEAIGEQVYSVTEIDRAQIDRSASNRLEDVIRSVSGFQQFRRSDSRSANPTSQGATLRALGGNASSRALLLLEGVPQTDPFGGWISWPALDPRRLERIRVIRGGGSGINGPGALAGTIELESRAAAEAETLAANIATGSRDSLDAFVDYGARLGEGELSVSAGWMRGDGFVPIVAEQRGPADRPAPYSQASIAVRAVAPLGDTTEVQTRLSAFGDRRERGTEASEIETSGADASLRLVSRGALPFSVLAYLQTRDFSNRFASLDPARSLVTQTLDQFSVPSFAIGARGEVRPRLGAVELRLGADFRLNDGETNELFSFVGGSPTRIRQAGGETITFGGFAEASAEFADWIVTAGARVDRWSIRDGRLSERQLAGGSLLTDVAFPDRSGWESTGRAGASWRAGANLRLRSAAYLGWRLPTLNELYRPFRIGADATAANAGLAPERLAGGELGADWTEGRLKVGLTFFVNRLADAIGNVTLGQGPGQFPGVGFVAGTYRRRDNLDAVTSRGVELDARWQRDAWDVSASYSFVDARLVASGASEPLDGLRPAQTPRHSAALSLGWTPAEGHRAALALRYVGSQYEDDLNSQLIPDALTLDGSAAWPLGERLMLEVRGENLTDARIVAGISGAGIIERATPRTLWVGLRWRS